MTGGQFRNLHIIKTTINCQHLMKRPLWSHLQSNVLWVALGSIFPNVTPVQIQENALALVQTYKGAFEPVQTQEYTSAAVQTQKLDAPASVFLSSQDAEGR